MNAKSPEQQIIDEIVTQRGLRSARVSVIALHSAPHRLLIRVVYQERATDFLMDDRYAFDMVEEDLPASDPLSDFVASMILAHAGRLGKRKIPVLNAVGKAWIAEHCRALIGSMHSPGHFERTGRNATIL